MIRNTFLRNERLFWLGQSAPEPMLRRRTRRVLLIILALTVIAMTVAVMNPWQAGWWLFAALVLAQGAFRWIAWRGIRGLSLAPSHLLDELQLQQVHSAYRRAYGIITAAACVLLAVFLFSIERHPVRVAGVGLFLLLEMLIWLPTAILAWRLEDEDPAESDGPSGIAPAASADGRVSPVETTLGQERGQSH
ncbi:hypothetical protein ABVG11_37040 [Streptomyces sp. HD1123-B1]|uniref:hypothetical protein n=1 Tax=Streptomyces huangiella TaxID=3228804 RepID=UPI003D7CA6B2